MRLRVGETNIKEIIKRAEDKVSSRVIHVVALQSKLLACVRVAKDLAVDIHRAVEVVGYLPMSVSHPQR